MSNESMISYKFWAEKHFSILEMLGLFTLALFVAHYELAWVGLVFWFVCQCLTAFCQMKSSTNEDKFDA
jgi:hypothetical protein